MRWTTKSQSTSPPESELRAVLDRITVSRAPRPLGRGRCQTMSDSGLVLWRMAGRTEPDSDLVFWRMDGRIGAVRK
jgi:hypothetical protein